MSEQKDEVERLTPDQIVRLPNLKYEPWFEVIGEYLGSAEVKGTFHMAIRIKEKVWRISVPIKSKEKDLLDMIGWLDDMPLQSGKRKRRVRILFTDNPEIPMKINSIEKI
jgi:hypothetical protein